ncbi:MAG: hypothetical protein ACXVAG_12505 [Vulcanimicrobiaceae bacterium]
MVCPPLLALAYDAVGAKLWCALALAYSPIAGGWIGLSSRPVFDAAADRANPRYEFSGKGAIVGASAAFLLAFLFVSPHADRTAVVALFFASSLFYYAIGKIGCFSLGCCRAAAPKTTHIPLPIIEAACSSAFSTALLVTLRGTPALRASTFAAVVVGFLALRIYSRCARGSSIRGALVQLDSLVLFVLMICVIVASIIIR